AHYRQLTHPIHTQAALHWHHFPDLVVDAFAPLLPSARRRASILCKAPCKKSTSSTFSASARAFSPAFTRATAASQNSRLFFLAPFRFATRSSFPAKCASSHCLTFGVQYRMIFRLSERGLRQENRRIY